MSETVEKSTGAKSKQWLLWLLATIALVALVLFIHARVQFSWTVFSQQLKQADWRKFVIAISMIYGAYVLRSFRWAIFLRPVKRVSPFALIGSQVIGFTGVALFGRLADLVRPYLIARRVKLTVGSQIAVYTVERMFDLGAMALIFSLALLFAPDRNTLPHHDLMVKVARGQLPRDHRAGCFCCRCAALGRSSCRLFGEDTRCRITGAGQIGRGENPRLSRGVEHPGFIS